MNDKTKAGSLLGISIGLLISLYISPSSTILSVSGRATIAIGCMIWSLMYIRRIKKHGNR